MEGAGWTTNHLRQPFRLGFRSVQGRRRTTLFCPLRWNCFRAPATKANGPQSRTHYLCCCCHVLSLGQQKEHRCLKSLTSHATAPKHEVRAGSASVEAVQPQGVPPAQEACFSATDHRLNGKYTIAVRMSDRRSTCALLADVEVVWWLVCDPCTRDNRFSSTCVAGHLNCKAE